jgi:hypothetical protein
MGRVKENLTGMGVSARMSAEMGLGVEVYTL